MLKKLKTSSKLSKLLDFFGSSQVFDSIVKIIKKWVVGEILIAVVADETEEEFTFEAPLLHREARQQTSTCLPILSLLVVSSLYEYLIFLCELKGTAKTFWLVNFYKKIIKQWA